jgi:hypothetical protein
MRDVRSIRWGIALAVLSAAVLGVGDVRAQTEDDLVAARKLFSEAVADEGAKLYDTALEKFRRVAAVKDTANVRYRVASCLEALGRRAEALASYEAAQRLGGGDPGAADVVHAAASRAEQLDRALPRLTVLVPSSAPPGTQVRVDDAPADIGSLRDGVPLDPGLHTITATAPGDAPFRTGVTLPEGGRVAITVTLEPMAAPTAEASRAPVPPPAPPQAPERVASAGGAPAGAWVALGIGGALAAGSITSFVLRASNLDTLTRDCQSAGSGALSCPATRSSEVNAAHNAAAIQGPLGIGLAAGAVLAAGIGVWLLASTHADGVHVTPVVTQTGGMLVLGGSISR